MWELSNIVVIVIVNAWNTFEKENRMWNEGTVESGYLCDTRYYDLHTHTGVGHWQSYDW